MNKNIVIGVLVVLTLVFGGLYAQALSLDKALGNLGKVIAELTLGKASGLSHFQVESFLQGLAGGQQDQFQVSNSGILTQGGKVYSTSTTGTVVLSADPLLNYGNIVNVPNSPATTIRMPTKAQLLAADPTFLKNAGDRTTRHYFNSTSSAIQLTTFTGNTGVIMQIASSSAAHNSASTIGNYGSAMFTFWRTATSTDIYFTVQTFK